MCVSIRVREVEGGYALAWTTTLAVTGIVLLLLAWRYRNGHPHRWTPEGIFPGGTAVEMCTVCGRRRAYVVDSDGHAVGIAEYRREHWENQHDKASAKDLRGRDGPHTFSPGAGEGRRKDFGGPTATGFREQRLRKGRRVLANE